MTDKIKISVDAMGGENSPKKIIEGIKISLKTNIENRFFLFGDENLLSKEINKDIVKLLQNPNSLFELLFM